MFLYPEEATRRQTPHWMHTDTCALLRRELLWIGLLFTCKYTEIVILVSSGFTNYCHPKQHKESFKEVLMNNSTSTNSKDDTLQVSVSYAFCRGFPLILSIPITSLLKEHFQIHTNSGVKKNQNPSLANLECRYKPEKVWIIFHLCKVRIWWTQFMIDVSTWTQLSLPPSSAHAWTWSNQEKLKEGKILTCQENSMQLNRSQQKVMKHSSRPAQGFLGPDV